MSLVRVWTDIGARKPVPLLAKIVDRDGPIFTIRYLSESDDKIWRYEEDTYEIDEDSISERLGTSIENDIGFQEHEDGFLKAESDDDYTPSSEDDDSSDEETDEFTDEEADAPTDVEPDESSGSESEENDDEY
jgi:hypothetical protein